MGLALLLLLVLLFGMVLSRTAETDAVSLSLSLIIGLAVLPLLVFVLSFAGFSMIHVVISVSIFVLLGFYFRWTHIRGVVPKISLVNIIAVALSVVGLSFFSFNQYFSESEGIRYFHINNAHDSLWHAALQQQLKLSVPPENPIFSGETLRGYHYFTDILFALVSILGDIHPIALTMQIIPVSIAIIFVLSNYLLACYLSKNSFVRALITLCLSLYSTQLHMMGRLFPDAAIHPSMFWLDQPATYLVNPQLVLSLAVVNVLIYLVLSRQKLYVVEILLLAALVGIKVYAVIVVLPVLLIYRLSEVKFGRRYFYAFTLVVVVGGVSLLLGSSERSLPFFLSPGWFVQQMFAASDRLNWVKWELERQHFVAVGAWHRWLLHWLYGVTIFFLGNLGLVVPAALASLKQFWNKQTAFLLGMCLISMVFPLLFLQSGLVWNTIQVLAYARIPLLLIVMMWLMQKAYRIQIVALLVLLLVSLPALKLSYELSMSEREAVTYSPRLLNSIVSLDAGGHTVIPVSGAIATTSLMPALTGEAVYMTDPGVLAILSGDIPARAETVVRASCTSGFVFIASTQDGLKNVDCTQALESFENLFD